MTCQYKSFKQEVSVDPKKDMINTHNLEIQVKKLMGVCDESLLMMFRFLAFLTLSQSWLNQVVYDFTSNSPQVLVQQHLCELAAANSLESQRFFL